ncbi:MAG: acyl carrier protein [Chitinophagales bacterium]
MERNQILSQLTEIFRRILGNPSLDLTEVTKASDVDNWDSLTHTLLLAEVQRHFEIKLKLREALDLKNIGDLCSLVSKKLNENS